MWGDRILFNPVGVACAESSPPQGTAPRPAGPRSRTLGFGVPPRCGEEMHTSGCGWPPGCGEEMRTPGCGWPPRCGEHALCQRGDTTCTGTVFMATRRTPGGSSPQRGGTPEPRVRPPRRKVRGRTLGTRAASRMHPNGVRQDRRGPIRPRHHAHVPHSDPRANRAALHGATAFCSTPLGFRSPNRRRPRVRLPGPRGRGAAPWALECHHVVVKRCTRTVLDCRHGVVKTRTLETRGGATPASSVAGATNTLGSDGQLIERRDGQCQFVQRLKFLDTFGLLNRFQK